MEVAIAKPDFIKNDKDLEFFLNNLSKMFASRIPTEDKRSMFVLKVVDFIDSSKVNSIVVPQLVHRLAGSDFDIDAVYGQMIAHYKTLNGENHVYGNYDNYSNEKIGKYI